MKRCVVSIFTSGFGNNDMNSPVLTSQRHYWT